MKYIAVIFIFFLTGCEPKEPPFKFKLGQKVIITSINNVYTGCKGRIVGNRSSTDEPIYYVEIFHCPFQKNLLSSIHGGEHNFLGIE